MQIKNITGLLDKLKISRELDRNKIILIITACLFLVYLDFSLLIKAQIRGAGALRPKIIKLKTDISDLAKGLAVIKEFTQGGSSPAVGQELARAKKIIREEELPLLLQEITDIANKTGAKIIQIKPIKDPKAKEETVAAVRVMPVMIKLDLYCGYHSLGSFVNEIENSKKFMLIQEIKILASSENYLYQDSSVTVKTYVKK
jgi:Tfp pilus assembly protein PilO